jgi:hypothetical protein
MLLGTQAWKADTPMNEHNDVVYHYTDASGLKGIVDHGLFWATDMQYLNDSAELTLLQLEAVEELRAYGRTNPQYAEIIEKAVPMLPLGSGSHYSVSFSEDADSLSQWRGYGGVQGYAIGFSKDSLYDVVQRDLDSARFARCKYDAGARAKQISETIRYAVTMLDLERAKHSSTWSGASAELAGDIAGGFSAIAPFFKHESFHEEREHRIVISNVSGGRIRVRDRAGELVPYVDVSAPVGKVVPNLGTIEGLKSIVIGPAATPKREKALRAYLSFRGLSTPIRLSQTPYLP